MNTSYYDEVSENLTTFVTECIFVSYAIRERRGKQTIAFAAVTCFFFIRNAFFNSASVLLNFFMN